MLSPLNSGGGT